MSRRMQVLLIVAAVVVVVIALVLVRRTNSDSASGDRGPGTTSLGSTGTSPGSTSATAGTSTPISEPTPPPTSDATTSPGGPTTSADPTTTAVGSAPTPPPSVTAAPPTSVPVAVSASQTTNLQNGQPVTVHVTAKSGTSVYGVTARLCDPKAVIELTADFLPSGGHCAPKPLSPEASGVVTVPIGPPNQSGELTFKVGVGTDTWTNDANQQFTLTCGPGHPCQLVLQLEIPEDTGFASVPVSFA